jgi:hypothetical protein
VGIYDKSDINEPKAWGIILSDIARHIANALNEMNGDQNCLEQVINSFINETGNPTSKTTGSFIS